MASYYLRYFYEHDHVVEQQRSQPSRAQEVAEIESQLLEIYANPAVDEKPALLQQRGGAYYSEAAVDLMASLITDRGDVQVVNLRNHGTLAFLADQAVIEVPARVNGRGPRPQTLRPVDPLLAGLIAHVSAYEELALDAAIRGGRERVFRALLAHPLIGQHDIADKLTDLLIAANRSTCGGRRDRCCPGDRWWEQQDRCLPDLSRRPAAWLRARAGSNHQLIGPDAAFDVLAGLVAEAGSEAGIDTGSRLAQHAAVYLAGADFPREVEMLLARVSLAGWAVEVSLDNDTFALLRAGTNAANRIAVVCGAGINCVGVSAAGDVLRFPSVGPISGDWGGGAALGTEALFLAVRAEDGRGQPTALREAVTQHFGTDSVRGCDCGTALR